LKLLPSQHTVCSELKQKYLITMPASKVPINLPFSITQAYNRERGALKANNDFRS
jgi:hypothetical protein